MSNNTASIGCTPVASTFMVVGSRLALGAVAADQRVGGAVVVELGLLGRLQLRDDPLRQHLAELDSPLVEGVDAPDASLGEDAVLIQRDQAAEDLWVEALGEDR